MNKSTSPLHQRIGYWWGVSFYSYYFFILRKRRLHTFPQGQESKHLRTMANHVLRYTPSKVRVERHFIKDSTINMSTSNESATSSSFSAKAILGCMQYVSPSAGSSFISLRSHIKRISKCPCNRKIYKDYSSY